MKLGQSDALFINRLTYFYSSNWANQMCCLLNNQLIFVLYLIGMIVYKYPVATTLFFIAKIKVASATAIIVSVPVRRCLNLVKEKKSGKAETVLCISPQSVPKLAERAQASRDGVSKPESEEGRTSAGLGRTGR